jgi:hypothetical protein
MFYTLILHKSKCFLLSYLLFNLAMSKGGGLASAQRPRAEPQRQHKPKQQESELSKFVLIYGKHPK